jgi:hypothetical protein
MRTRAVLVLLALAVLALGALPAAAQSGRGIVSGLVLPEDSSSAGGAGQWEREGPSDDTYAIGPVLTLEPVFTLGDAAPMERRARGIYGRYTFGVIPMGLYRLRAEAPGYAPWEAEVYVPSDSEARIFILLHRKGED